MSDTPGDSTQTVITLDGEFDISGTEWFLARVAAGLRKQAGGGTLVVDARGLTFMDSSGLRSLLRARAAADDAGVRFCVSASSVVRRLVERTGLRAHLLGA
jgi:anti-anti-sigma factor